MARKPSRKLKKIMPAPTESSEPDDIETEEPKEFECEDCTFRSFDKDECRDHFETEHLVPNQMKFNEIFGEDL